MKNSKHILVLFFVFISTIQIHAQVHFEEIEYHKLPFDRRELKKIIQTEDDGFLVMGNSVDTIADYDGIVYSYIEFIKKNAWVVKIDSAYHVQWTQQLDKPFPSYFSAGCQLSDGGYMLTGIAFPEDSLVAGREDNDILITRLDSVGNIILDTIFTQFAFQSGIDVREDINGDILVFTNVFQSTPTLEEYWDYTNWEFYYARPFWRTYKIKKETNAISLVNEIEGVSAMNLAKVTDAEDGGYLLWGSGCGFYGANPFAAWAVHVVKLDQDCQTVSINRINYYEPYLKDVIKTYDGYTVLCGSEMNELNFNNSNKTIATTNEAFEEIEVLTPSGTLNYGKFLIQFPDSTIAVVMNDWLNHDEFCCIDGDHPSYVTRSYGIFWTIDTNNVIHHQTFKENFNASNMIPLDNNEYIIAGNEQPQFGAYSPSCQCFYPPHSTPVLYKFRWIGE